MPGRNHFLNPILLFHFYCSVARLGLGKGCKQMVNEEFWEHPPNLLNSSLLEYSTSETNPRKCQYGHIYLKFIVHLVALKKSATHDTCP